MKSIHLILSFLLLVAPFTQAQIKIQTGGNVSIGSTVAPISGYKLQVFGNSVFSANSGTITSSALIRGLNAYSTATNPDFTFWGNDQLGIFHPSNNVLGFTSGGLERMRITSSGVQINSSGDWLRSIFINATTPNTVGYHMKYGASDNFYVHASGWIYSQGLYIGSDKAFKRDIIDIPNSLNKIKQMRGVNYKLNRAAEMSIFNTNETYMGVVAQEVEKVVPEVVKTFPDGTKAVAYQSLVGLLIEAVKEQQIMIEEMQREMKVCCLNNNENRGYRALNSYNDTTLVDIKGVLYQNTPNPFTESTVIKYAIPSQAKSSSIYLFDMQGALLKSYSNLTPGTAELIINGGDFKAGMYIYSLIIDGKEVDSKRMILTK